MVTVRVTLEDDGSNCFGLRRPRVSNPLLWFLLRSGQAVPHLWYIPPYTTTFFLTRVFV